MVQPSNSPEIDDAIKSVLDGDTDRYSEVVTACESRVRAVVAGMCPDPNNVPDLTQEVFIIAYERLSSYKQGTNFIAWIRTIARNVCQNERRRWYRRRNMEERYQTEVEDHIAESIDAIMETIPEDSLDSLRDCMGNLGDKTRCVVDGFYFKEQTIKQISELLELSVSAAKVTLHRARLAIGNCLRKKGDTDA